jgi:hypothetical protein
VQHFYRNSADHVYVESSDSDDHFSDAQSGLEHSGGASPVVPLTRIEKVEDEPRHGEVPGTEAYAMRESDAAPDKVAIIPEGKANEENDTVPRSPTPGGRPIPSTLVEKVDPSSPSHGEVPGTLAHDKRAADAVPDMVVKTGNRRRSPSTRSRAGSTPGDLPIPTTKVEKVDSEPSHGEVPGTKASEMRKEDAEPDAVEEVGYVPGKIVRSPWNSERLTESGSPTSPAARPSIASHARRKSSGAGRKAVTDEYNEEEDGADDGFGDDFDDFEEGEEDAEFGDFDDGFQESEPAPPPPAQPVAPTPSFVSFQSIMTRVHA